MSKDIDFLCPFCQQIIEAPSDMAGEIVDCPGCNRQITVPSPKPEVAKPQVRVSTRPTQVAPPAGVALAGILCALWAALTVLVSLRFLLVYAAAESISWELSETEAILIAVWNMMISAVYVLFAVRIWKMEPTWGYNWPLWSNILNGTQSIFQILRCVNWSVSYVSLDVKAFGSITLPIEIAVVLLLLFNRKAFSQKERP